METSPTSPTPAPEDPTVTHLHRPQGGLAKGDVLLGRYRVEQRLGAGGEAEVWLCEYLPAGIRVALKVVPELVRSSEREMERIRASFRLAHELHHPHIAAVKFLDEDPDTGRVYLVLEYVEGLHLGAYLRAQGGRLPLPRALEILQQAAEGLDYAHSRGVVHRDIKPENLMITPDGRVKILDFGIAAAIRESVSRVTHSALLAQGTPRFMAPEQWLGHPQDGRTDQYALAMTLVLLVAGAPPFDGISNLQALREAHLGQPPDRPDPFPAEHWPPVARALAKTPEERHPDCLDFILTARDGPNHRAQRDPTGAGSAQTPGPAPLHAARSGGFEYRTESSLLGFPLVHVAIGLPLVEGRRQPARGIIAIGDSPVGAVAIGTFARGGIAFGTVAFGLFPTGLFALGLFPVGALALGILAAYGVIAVAPIAVGCLAAGYYSAGGVPLGRFVYNPSIPDLEGRRFFASWLSPWFHAFMIAQIFLSYILRRLLGTLQSMRAGISHP